MAQNEQIVVPITCGNSSCRNFNRLVNVISGISVEDMDLFYQSYDGSDPHDYCPVCGELGIAEDMDDATHCLGFFEGQCNDDRRGSRKRHSR